MKVVSIVAPVYNEEGNVEELVSSIVESMLKCPYEYEIILVNDGSKDSTWSKVQSLSRKYKQLIGINLAGNYGQTIALRAGFEKAEGEIIIAMDGDLQHDPKYIPQFVDLMIKGGYDMVGGSKLTRPGSKIKGWFANRAHNIIERISGVKMKYFGATFKAYRRYLLEDINMLGDAHRYLGAMVARKGTRFIEVPIEIRERKAGVSSYSFKKAFLVMVDLFFLKFMISYIHKPFRPIGVIGLLNFIGGLGLTSYFLFGSLFLNFNIRVDYMAEFLFSSFLMLMGTMFICVGIIAELMAHNYFQRNFQSPYKVRETTQRVVTWEESEVLTK